MQQHLDVLKKYFGHDSFRPLQGDIIKSIASGKDTLGLMPTGGGKSLTFQVPTMTLDGLCLVITPLIALMKDQVASLKKRGIRAVAISSDMSQKEILQTLENAVFDAYKFLYISPERLATPIFIDKISQTNVCMIAVDESHCISQWGYDFRPSYLRIVDIRQILPGVPVLALTATATPEVVDDIQEKLGFKEKNVFRKSFYRSNLAYIVRVTENKEASLLKILSNVPGSSVVYVRNRKRTKEIADFLNKNGLAAEHFHAGLQSATKDVRQSRWMSNETRVIVSTNAFGMGIDKPDVRTVVHMDLPDSLEAYFQEAGRAGRDEQKAYAVLLYNGGDAVKMRKRVADSFPEKEFVRKTYELLSNYLLVALGSGQNRVFSFDIGDFCTQKHLPILPSYNALKILQQAGYLELSDEQHNASRLLFSVHKEDLYSLKQSSRHEQLFSLLLRSYTGLFTEPAYINEQILADRLQWTPDEVYQLLVEASKMGVVQYIPRKKSAFLSFLQDRVETKRLILKKEAYDDRKERYVVRAKSVLDYAQEENGCRSQILLRYFGEKNIAPCGQCDLCLKKREGNLSDIEFEKIRSLVLALLSEKSLSSHDIIEQIDVKDERLLSVLRFMQDSGEIEKDLAQRFGLVDKRKKNSKK